MASTVPKCFGLPHPIEETESFIVLYNKRLDRDAEGYMRVAMEEDVQGLRAG